MSTVMPVNLGQGETEVVASVTSFKSEVDLYIRNFLSNRDNIRKVIGLDVELTVVVDDSEDPKLTKDASRVAILQLCDGDSCLIIQLPFLDSVPKSLLNFLQLPDFVSVGIGIKGSVAKLEKEYGLGCKNCVELGQLAASVMQMPHLTACGLEFLAHTVEPLMLGAKPTSVVFCDWGKHDLNRKQIKFAAANVFAYFKIGTKLLSG